MELKINNNIKQFDCNQITIQELLDLELPSKQNGIAVAINQKIIAKNNWDSFLLNQNDEILIITATQGG